MKRFTLLVLVFVLLSCEAIDFQYARFLRNMKEIEKKGVSINGSNRIILLYDAKYIIKKKYLVGLKKEEIIKRFGDHHANTYDNSYIGYIISIASCNKLQTIGEDILWLKIENDKVVNVELEIYCDENIE